MTMQQTSRTASFAAGHRPADRQAAALAIVLGVMILASVLLAAWARTVIDAHRQQRREQRRSQVEWLVEGGIERAVAQLSRADDYTGETWRIAAEELGGRDVAVVVIHVEPVADAATRRTVHVRADYPEKPDRRVRHSKQITVDLDQLTEGQTHKLQGDL
jgi:membrane protein implicated in regulation of membrane protease activity